MAERETDLKIEVTNCLHYTERNRKGEPTFRLELEFRIKNTGHYGTTLSKIEAVFHDSEKEYLMKSDLFQTEQEHPLTLTLPVENLWVQPHKTTDTGSVFLLKGTVIKQKVLKCSFILYHTHNEETFKVTSPFPPSS